MTTHKASNTAAGTAPQTPPTESVAAPPTAPVTGATHNAIVDATKAARIKVREAIQIVLALIGTPATGVVKHRTNANARRKQAVPLLSEMLRVDPTLCAKVTPDDLDAAMAAGQALDFFTADLKLARTTIAAAAKSEYNEGWWGASMVYSTAETEAAGSDTVSESLAEVRAILANGPRSKTSPVVVAKAENNANVIAERARKAAATAAKKQRSAERTAQAHADAHPDVTIVPATNPTGTTGNNNGK